VVLLRALRYHGVQGDVYQPQAGRYSLEKVQEMPPVQEKQGNGKTDVAFQVMRRSRFSAILLFLLFLSSLAYAGQPQQATVLKITDGDTLWVRLAGQKTKLRLLGIDTPEKYHGKKLTRDAVRCGVSEKYMASLGRRATRHAKKLVHVGDTAQVDIRGYGYYGRGLAVVYLADGTCLNTRMVQDGYAWVYRYHGRKSRQLTRKEFDNLARLMRDAKESKRGLWGRDYRVMDCLSRR